MHFTRSELHWMFATLHELRALSREGVEATPMRIARAAHIKKQAVYRALYRLQELGLVATAPGNDNHWKLTPAASEAA